MIQPWLNLQTDQLLPHLEHTVNITLGEAFDGWSRTIATVNGPILKFTCSGPSHPSRGCRIPNLGLLDSPEGDTRGSLYIWVRITYPDYLDEKERSQQEQILLKASPRNLDWKIQSEKWTLDGRLDYSIYSEVITVHDLRWERDEALKKYGADIRTHKALLKALTT